MKIIKSYEFVSVLVLIMIFQSLLFIKLRNKYKEKIHEYIVNVKKENYVLEKINELESLDRGEKINIFSLLKSNDILETIGATTIDGIICLRLPEVYCSTCINRNIDRLLILSSHLDKNRLFILTKKQDSIMLYYYKRRHPMLKNNIFNINSLPLKIEQQNIPYLLVLDNNFHVRNVHVFNKNFNERSEFFINGLINYYKAYDDCQKE